MEKECAFKIIGWKKFCENAIIHHHQMWHHNVRITININSNPNPESLAKLSKACQKICHQRNDVIFEYEGQLNSWGKDDLKLYGSANCVVIPIRYLY